jgi:hypothetical protein
MTISDLQLRDENFKWIDFPMDKSGKKCGMPTFGKNMVIFPG